MEQVLKITDQGSYMEVVPVRYAYPNGDNYWDKNWLDIHINIKAGAFKGSYSCNFQTSDFVTLHEEIEKLYQNMSYEFTFSTLEDQIKIHFKGDGLGHIALDCTAMDQAGIGNTLDFELNIDQTYLPQMLIALKNINNLFKVIV